MKPVSVADDFAGREVTCPSCMKPFDAPAKYTPAVLSEPAAPAGLAPPARQETKPSPPPEHTPMSPDVPSPHPAPSDRPVPPPGLVPPIPPVPQPSAATPAPSVAMPAGYTRSVGFSISPKVVAWLPAVLLTVTLIATFFPWVGSYLGGYPVYSQNPWQAMFGYPSRNFALEEKASVPNAWLEKLTNNWEMLLPALLALVIAVCLSWADRGFHSLDPRKIPPLAGIWPWRKLIIAVLAGLTFTLLLIQVCRGFGMERAIRQVVRENPALAKERQEAGTSEWKLAAVENKEEQELAKYNLERTTWLYLGLACNLLAVLAMLGHIGLDRRGDKPPPRLVVQY